MIDPAQKHAARKPVLLGVSLKLYLDIDDSVAWAREIAEIADARGRISAEFGSDATKEMIMAASGEAVAA